MNRSEGNLTGRSVLVIIVLPFLALFFATFLVRLAYEETKFRGAQTTSAFEKANVISKSSKWRRSARVNFGYSTRDIYVPINRQAHSRLEPWREPGRDCLVLQVQTGRDGVRRAIVPVFLEPPVGIDSYRLCE